VVLHPSADQAAFIDTDFHRLLGVGDPEPVDVGAHAQVGGQLGLVLLGVRAGPVDLLAVVQAVCLGGHHTPPGVCRSQELAIILQELVKLLQRTADSFRYGELCAKIWFSLTLFEVVQVWFRG
jgi:hypothetical protein